MIRRFAALGMVAALLAGCGKDPVQPGPDGPWMAVELDDRFVHGYTDFGFDLLRALTATEPDANVFISPTSAAFALAMTYNGAVGETRDAMAQVLGVDGMTRDEVNANNRRWLESLVTTGRSVELAIANSLWIRQGFPVESAFLDRTRTFYQAEARELDFASPAAPAAINDWVQRNTGGKIDRILDAVPGNVMLYLINALYFQGDWTHPFDARVTRDDVFTRADGSQRTVPMMTQDRLFPVVSGDGFSAVSLPYGNGRFSMVLALPDEGVSLQEMYAGLDAASWAASVDALAEHRVMVSLPRFELEWESSLNEALIGLGMGIAFAMGPEPHDFTDLSAANPWIGEVKQKTYLSVDEEGTTAAAATSVAMPTSMPPVMRFDRPFFLSIYDNATRTMLFAGQVTDPS